MPTRDLPPLDPATTDPPQWPILWAGLARHWDRWREVLVFVQPITVVARQRRRFRDHWARLSRRASAGRPAVSQELRMLIRDIAIANPRWGSPRILGELRKLGIPVAKYRVRPSRPTSPFWRAFLKNHVADLGALDFFTVPTDRFRVLFVLIVLAHDRRRIVHCNVTAHPTAQWTAQQAIEAFPWETAPTYILRDRDGVYGTAFQRRVAHLGIEEVLTTPRSPWQNPYAERLSGSIRRECLEQVMVFSEEHLRRVLARYFAYYNRGPYYPTSLCA